MRLPSVKLARQLALLAASTALSIGTFGPASAALFVDGLHEAPHADFDVRDADASFTATAAQLAAVPAGAMVRWNEHGTPATLIKHGDFLATGLDADPATAARDYLRANAALFRLDIADIDALELYHVGELAHSRARAVKFRQNFGGLASQGGGLVTVGVLDGKVSIVTSSIVPISSSSAVPAATVSAAQALAIAAQDVGFDVNVASVSAPTADNDWSTFEIAGLSGTQRVRPMAFPTAAGVRPVHETWLVTANGGGMTAYMHLVDAANGEVLYRQNKLFQAADFEMKAAAPAAKAPSATAAALMAPVTTPFSGIYTGAVCGPSATTYHGPFTVTGTEGYTSAEVQASAINPVDDIVIDVYIDRHDGNGIVFLARFDFLFSPETGTISPVEVADYYVQVCAFDGQDPILPPAPPAPNYEGSFTLNDTAVGGTDARWLHFESNPEIDLSSVDTRALGCWQGTSAPCDFTVANVAARGPWDWDYNAPAGGAPSNTTIGNASIVGEAWLSPLTPAEQYRPVEPTRDYSFAWTNAWYTSPIDGTGCSPNNFVPQGNDIDAATVNMFVGENRLHNWAYYLGFTEANSNFQTRNFGNTPADRENDPIIGNVQAGAIDGAFPAYLGRDNANFIPQPDGVPGITNQYLWQALLGTIYTPCADGNFDMGIIGHEIGHGIQHRMTGGPDAGLGGSQGGAMGESWSDLTGMEIQNEFGSVPTSTESPYAIGVYVLGAPERGIRNYNMSNSPLNYSNYTYDPFGNSSPHANGEIWSATQFQVRQAFIDQHEGTDPSTDAVKQRQCAEGKFAPGDCPGNRRYIQIMHDGFLLQPQAPSFVDARDAQFAADLMRFAEDAGWGNHYDAMWLAYAQRGLGFNAASAGSNDSDPTADFSLPPDHSLANAVMDFTVLAQDESDAPIANAQIFIGHYQARANPIATTDGSGLGTATIAPGTYDMLARANGYGHMRFQLELDPGQTGPVMVKMPTNFASASKGASASGVGSSVGSLLDDTEATAWSFTGNNQIGVGAEETVTVDLGTVVGINRVQVSALPNNGQNRYENLRQFAVDACAEGLTNDCTDPSDFTRVYTSDIDAFNGQPIRPLAPNLIIQSFDLGQTVLASHLRFVALHNQCTGSSEFTSNNWATGALAPDDVQDCRADGHPILADRDDVVRASEFQAFGSVGNVVVGTDTDGDGVLDEVDNCPLTANADQSDVDGDSVGDVCDNCLLEANPDQCNTNAGVGPGLDQIGNVCDADLDNNGIINSFDLTILRNNFGASGANDADITCNGIVNSFDLTELRNDFGQAPGPTGIAP